MPRDHSSTDSDVQKYYGKPIDPRKFKQRDLSNLRDRVEVTRERAKEFRPRADIEVEACPVCDSPSREVACEMHGYEYVRCSQCTHVYLSTRLPEEALLEFYQSSSDFADHYTNEEQITYRLESIIEPKIEFVLDQIGLEKGRWLDVGCGIGGSVHYLESQGWEADGLDISEDCVEVAADVFEVSIQQRTLEEHVATDPDPYDVVSFFGYLCLIPQPMPDLQRARDLLTEEGTVCIGEMNHDSVSTQVQTTFPDWAVRHLIPPNGMHHFTEHSLATALHSTGFDRDAIWYFGLDFYEFLNHVRLAVDGFSSSPLYNYCLNNLSEFQHVIDKTEQSDYQLLVGSRR
ncbi:class I SAM-dependent methyltransferase [Natrialbaceae archaeon A-CW1-1]